MKSVLAEQVSFSQFSDVTKLAGAVLGHTVGILGISELEGAKLREEIISIFEAAQEDDGSLTRATLAKALRKILKRCVELFDRELPSNGGMPFPPLKLVQEASGPH